MINMIRFTAAALLVTSFNSFSASYSDNEFKDVTIEVKKAPVPIAINIIPAEITEGDLKNGTKVADINLKTNDGSSQKLAMRFSPSNLNQTTEKSGTKTILKGSVSANLLPLYLVGEDVNSVNINEVQMEVTKTATPSYTFKAVLAGDHKVYADTYKLSVEGAIYNP